MSYTSGQKNEGKIRFTLPNECSDNEDKKELESVLNEISKEKRRAIRSSIGPTRNSLPSRTARAISAPNMSDYKDELSSNRNSTEAKIGAYVNNAKKISLTNID